VRIKLLPSNCSDPQRLQSLTTFLINDHVAVDAGSLGYALSVEAQRSVRHILISHTHSDHTASLPILVAEVYPLLREPLIVYGSDEVVSVLRAYVFNDQIWPDFARIKLMNGNHPSLEYRIIEPRVSFQVEELRITPIPSNHVVPTTGFVVEDDHSAVIFTSDTYHTEEIWQVADATNNLTAIFVDVSYPNELEALAAASKHLTPQALAEELTKLHRPAQIFAVHIKPQLRSEVIRQLLALNRTDVAVAEIGKEYSW
jgi:cAMP phosphodiesterase